MSVLLKCFLSTPVQTMFMEARSGHWVPSSWSCGQLATMGVLDTKPGSFCKSSQCSYLLSHLVLLLRTFKR